MTLEFTLNRSTAATTGTDCVVVGAFSDGSLSPAAQALDGEGRLEPRVRDAGYDPSCGIWPT